MKLWIPVALGSLIVGAYALFYALSSAETQGATSIGLANSVGLAAVFVGLIAAGLILRRAAPPQRNDSIQKSLRKVEGSERNELWTRSSSPSRSSSCSLA